jgi:acyl-CoA thioesterase FadM
MATNPNTHLLQRRVQFYETDMMGVVHHSNYACFDRSGGAANVAMERYLATSGIDVGGRIRYRIYETE